MMMGGLLDVEVELMPLTSYSLTPFVYPSYTPHNPCVLCSKSHIPPLSLHLLLLRSPTFFSSSSPILSYPCIPLFLWPYIFCLFILHPSDPSHTFPTSPLQVPLLPLHASHRFTPSAQSLGRFVPDAHATACYYPAYYSLIKTGFISVITHAIMGSTVTEREWMIS